MEDTIVSTCAVPAPQTLSQPRCVHAAERVALAAMRRDRRGSVAAVVGLSAPLLIGFLGFAIDMAMWEGSKVGAQAAADQAALAAGIAISKASNATTEARAVTASFGYVHGVKGVQVTVHQPPTSGTFSTNAQAVEVKITKPEGPYFSAAYRPAAPIVRARSVSAPIGAAAGGGMCVMALERTNTGLSTNGSTVLDSNTCNIYVNSTNVRAVNMIGTSGRIKGYDIFIGGGIRATGNAAVTPSHSLQTYYSPPTADPYAARVIPAFSGCNHTGLSINSSQTFSASGSTPYVFCNGLSIGSSTTVTFNPGVYVVDRGNFSVSGTATINAPGGVTIILSSSTGSGIGSFSVTGSPTFNIKARPTGPTAGIALWIDKRATSNFSVSGGSLWNITGAYYMPNAALSWNGSGSSPCTQLVAKTISISGSGVLKHDCAGVGVSDPPGSGGATMSRLVE